MMTFIVDTFRVKGAAIIKKGNRSHGPRDNLITPVLWENLHPLVFLTNMPRCAEHLPALSVNR